MRLCCASLSPCAFSCDSTGERQREHDPLLSYSISASFLPLTLCLEVFSPTHMQQPPVLASRHRRLHVCKPSNGKNLSETTKQAKMRHNWPAGFFSSGLGCIRRNGSSVPTSLWGEERMRQIHSPSHAWFSLPPSSGQPKPSTPNLLILSSFF